MNERKRVSVSPNESVSLTIVETVAELTDTDPFDLDPLGHVVETDALDDLFAPSAGLDCTDAYLTFGYGGCSVAVTGDGTVSVRRDSAPEFDHEASLDADTHATTGGRNDESYRYR